MDTLDTMISPDPEAPTVSSVQPEPEEVVLRFLGPGGGLESACAKAKFAYEARPQQLAMAEAIAQAVASREHLVVEAGTGVGKSFAYLVPMIHAALARKVKLVVATHTISLQEQLYYKDLPFLQSHMGVSFRAALVKGRSNYLCLRRLDRARKMGDDLFQAQQGIEFDLIRDWADQTTDGSLQDLEQQPSPDVWNTVCAEQGNCQWQKCPEYKPCFFMNARRRMFEADVLVVNHHVLFSELALRAQGASFLPPYELLVLDEAHEIEDVASEHMGVRVSQYMVNYWLRRLYNPDREKGILAALKHGAGAKATSDLKVTTDRFFGAVRRWGHFPDGESRKVVESGVDFEVPMAEGMGALNRLLSDVAEGLEDEEMQAEVLTLQRRGAEMRASLRAFLGQGMEDHVYWVEQSGSRYRNISLRSAPIEVGPALKEHLFGAFEGIVLTSATLAVGGELTYFRDRVGAEGCRVLQVGSPFQYERQMRVYLPEAMPNPNDTEAYNLACAKAVMHFVRKSAGRAFILFTSGASMKRVAGEVRDGMTEEGFELMVQGEGLPRHLMLERFRRTPMCVLFGLNSFWMGVDVPGEALQNVMITRLPFAVPDQPLIRARMKRIEERGGNAFRDYSLPEAILKFRQGVGRLIRTATDEGFVVILDGRIRSQWYGKWFLKALPECPVEVVEI
jgi:ATP-dependent DNA helicase DinG